MEVLGWLLELVGLLVVGVEVSGLLVVGLEVSPVELLLDVSEFEELLVG